MPNTVILSLAFRELIQANGGLVQAAKISGKGKSQLGKYQDTGADSLPDIGVVAVLEAHSGCTAVSDALRGLHALPGEDAPECPMALGNVLAGATGLYCEESVIVTSDGIVTRNERVRLIKRLLTLTGRAYAGMRRLAGGMNARKAACP